MNSLPEKGAHGELSRVFLTQRQIGLWKKRALRKASARDDTMISVSVLKKDNPKNALCALYSARDDTMISVSVLKKDNPKNALCSLSTYSARDDTMISVTVLKKDNPKNALCALYSARDDTIISVSVLKKNVILNHDNHVP